MKNQVIVGIIVLECAVMSSARADTITFDEGGLAPQFFVNAQPLRTAYLASEGVNFFGPTSDGGGAILSQSSNFGIGAFSGTNFLAFNTDSTAVMANGGFPIGPETITFASGVSDVSIMAAEGSVAGLFTLTAYDAASNVVGSSMVTTTGWSKLEVSSATPIASVSLSFNSPAALFDNLSFTPAAVPEPVTTASLLGLGAFALIRRRR